MARLVSLFSTSIQAIFPGPLYRAMQHLKACHLRLCDSYEQEIALDSETRVELLWWLRHMEAWNGKAFFGATLDFVLESDASLLG